MATGMPSGSRILRFGRGTAGSQQLRPNWSHLRAIAADGQDQFIQGIEIDAEKASAK